MKFVTKKEFDDAVAVINNALGSGQLIDGYGKFPLTKVLFGTDGDVYDVYELSQVSFIASDLAIKDKLFNLRKELYKQRENTDKNKKELEILEKEEQKLAALLPKTKE